MIARFQRWLRRFTATGPRGERAAARYLKQHGYRVLARNVRNRFGEIDIIAQPRNDARTVVIVEVKAAAGEPGRPFRPEVHVNHAKRRKLVALSAQVLRACRLTDRRVRYDVVAVELPSHGPPVIRHHPGAFESHV